MLLYPQHLVQPPAQSRCLVNGRGADRQGPLCLRPWEEKAGRPGLEAAHVSCWRGFLVLYIYVLKGMGQACLD